MKICIKKGRQQDIFAVLVYLVTFTALYLILTRGGYLFGSTMDYQTQHYLLPEYLRTLFYQTGDLFPDFAPQLGGGQNIYYISYYGLLNPLILLSYLLPFVNMLDYIIVVSCLCALAATVLFYGFLKKHGYPFWVCFLTGFLFLCASPLLFHAHRHIMFMDYMPFLILGFFGMDRLMEQGKSFLLILAAFLMIMTSYYFSVAGLLVLFLYGIYLFLKSKDPHSVKATLIFLLRITIPLVTAVLMSAVLLLPTLYTLVSGRSGGTNTLLPFWQLLIPKDNFTFILLNPYSPGLCAISLIAIVTMLFSKKRAVTFLAVLAVIISTLPLFNYVLNGTLYVNGKSLIPFLPLLLIITAEFFTLLFTKEIKKSTIFCATLLLLPFLHRLDILAYLGLGLTVILLAKGLEKKGVLIALTVIIAFGSCLAVNLQDELIPQGQLAGEEYQNDTLLAEEIAEKDTGRYRINNEVCKNLNMNRAINENTYKNTIYSSASNPNFSNFCFDIMNNEIPYRNRSMIPSTTNPLFHILTNEKYIITDGAAPIGYTPISAKGNVTSYQNENVFPLGYASSLLMKESTFYQMGYPYNVTQLFSHIVTRDKEAGSKKIPLPLPVSVNTQIIQQQGVTIKQQGNLFYIDAAKENSLSIKTRIPMEQNLLFLRFQHIGNKKTDAAITINGTTNKITAKNWKYYNGNKTFDYVLSNTGTLDIHFSKGIHVLKNISFATMDYNTLAAAKQNLDAFEIDTTASVGDHIQGTVDVENNGYFMLTIPYDKGFHITVDGVPTQYEKVNTAYIGFPITAGNHEIKLEFKAPYKSYGILFSSLGLLLCVVLLFFERRKPNPPRKH